MASISNAAFPRSLQLVIGEQIDLLPNLGDESLKPILFLPLSASYGKIQGKGNYY
jgi:hypothetical protein